MRRSRSLVPIVVVAAGAFASLAAGCGNGGGSPGVASVVSSTTSAATTTQSGLLAFSSCMRSNGMPSFPDPQRFVGGNLKLTLHQSADTPQFRAAMTACNQLLPPNGGGAPQETAQQQRTRLADGLSFARCMRSHGVTSFPDPTAQGQLTVEMVEAQGIDVHSQAVLRVVQECLPASHGALTPAKVREAIDDAGG
jgi:hypothetical protein